MTTETTKPTAVVYMPDLSVRAEDPEAPARWVYVALTEDCILGEWETLDEIPHRYALLARPPALLTIEQMHTLPDRGRHFEHLSVLAECYPLPGASNTTWVDWLTPEELEKAHAEMVS